MSTSSGINSTVQQYVPWRKGIAWWVVLIQGLVLLALGAYALWSAKSATQVIIFGIGLYLVGIGVWTVIQAIRGKDAGLSVFGLLAAGGGLVAGISVLLPYFFGVPDTFKPTFFTFGVALITIGLLTLFAAFVERPESGIVWTTLIRGLVWTLLGTYMVYAIATGVVDSALVRWIAIAFLVLGALLTVFSIVLNRRQASAKAAATAPPAPPDAPAEAAK